MDSSTAEAYSNLPLMTFLDTTERTVTVTSVDSNHTFWIRFVQDKINVFISSYILTLIFLVITTIIFVGRL